MRLRVQYLRGTSRERLVSNDRVNPRFAGVRHHGGVQRHPGALMVDRLYQVEARSAVPRFVKGSRQGAKGWHSVSCVMGRYNYAQRYHVP